MAANTDRTDEGQFHQKVDDHAVLLEVVSAERALATNEVAERLDLPRTTARDALERLRDEGYMKSDLAHGKTRLWWVPGNWGGTSIVDVYPGDEMKTFLETGYFPEGTTFEQMVGMIEESFIELNWAVSFAGGYVFGEIERLAELFDMDFREFVQCSPGDVYSLIHEEGALRSVPTLSTDEGLLNELPTGPEFRESRKTASVAQADVAKRAAVNESYVSQWERGKKELPANDVRQLYDALEELR